MGIYQELPISGSLHNGGKPVFYKPGDGGSLKPAFLFFWPSDKIWMVGGDYSVNSKGLKSTVSADTIPGAHDCSGWGGWQSWLSSSSAWTSAYGISVVSADVDAKTQWDTASAISSDLSDCACSTVRVAGATADQSSMGDFELMGPLVRVMAFDGMQRHVTAIEPPCHGM